MGHTTGACTVQVQSEYPMTIQLNMPPGLSKKGLEEKLNAAPSMVTFYNPSILREGYFTGADLKVGEHMTVVLDHPKRQRFAVVLRVDQDKWKVE